MAVHDPQQYLKETSREWDIFQYHYQHTMKDKIYVSQLKDKDIKTLCVDSIAENINAELAGEIKKEYRITSIDTINAVQKELSYHVSNLINAPVNDINLYNSKDNFYSLWVNFQNQHEFNPSHSHDGMFSFVFYAAIPESIRQEHAQKTVGNSPSRGLIQFRSELSNDSMIFNPSEDTIFIFESSHMHQVYPFSTDATRISIAGNIYGWS